VLSLDNLREGLLQAGFDVGELPVDLRDWHLGQVALLFEARLPRVALFDDLFDVGEVGRVGRGRLLRHYQFQVVEVVLVVWRPQGRGARGQIRSVDINVPILPSFLEAAISPWLYGL